MEQITLTYTGGSVILPVLSVKGISDPDWIQLWPAIINTYLDGSMESQFTSFRRRVRIDCGVVPLRADRIKILRWYMDNGRTLTYGSYAAIPFVPQSSEYENVWEEDFSEARRFVFELEESVVYQVSDIATVFP